VSLMTVRPLRTLNQDAAELLRVPIRDKADRRESADALCVRYVHIRAIYQSDISEWYPIQAEKGTADMRACRDVHDVHNVHTSTVYACP